MRWTSSSGTATIAFFRRFGIKAGIVVAGAIVAAGSLHRTTYVSHTPLAQRIVASAPVPMKTPWGTTPSPDSSIAPGGLDAGMDHDRIAYWVKKLTTTMSSDFARTLDRKAKYSDMIESKLAAKNMPKDLVYLAMIESEFNPNAKSPVKALGLWQFMSATARRFGLTVKGKVDERRDPARATDAAVAYLSDLHARFGSWYLAAAAYNSGEGTVLKALRATTGRSTGTDEDFWRILPMLPKETQDYVPKLIAAARVGNAPERYGLTVHESSASGSIDTAAAIANANATGTPAASTTPATPVTPAATTPAPAPAASNTATSKSGAKSSKASKASKASKTSKTSKPSKTTKTSKSRSGSKSSAKSSTKSGSAHSKPASGGTHKSATARTKKSSKKRKTT